MSATATDDTIIPPRKKTPRVWHPQHDVILKSWGEASGCYRFMHYRSFKKFRFLNAMFTLPVIIISTITGTANFAQSTIPANVRKLIPFVIGSMSLFAAILSTVQQYLKIPELAEGHRTAYVSYGKLARDIRLQLSLPIQERGYHGENFVSFCNTEYDRLIEQSPPIPGGVIHYFKRKFDEPDMPVDMSFNRPEVFSVKVITPYTGTFETILREHKERIESETINTHVDSIDKIDKHEEDDEVEDDKSS